MQKLPCGNPTMDLSLLGRRLKLSMSELSTDIFTFISNAYLLTTPHVYYVSAALYCLLDSLWLDKVAERNAEFVPYYEPVRGVLYQG